MGGGSLTVVAAIVLLVGFAAAPSQLAVRPPWIRWTSYPRLIDCKARRRLTRASIPFTGVLPYAQSADRPRGIVGGASRCAAGFVVANRQGYPAIPVQMTKRGYPQNDSRIFSRTGVARPAARSLPKLLCCLNGQGRNQPPTHGFQAASPPPRPPRHFGFPSLGLLVQLPALCGAREP